MARHGWQGSTGEYDETFTCAECGRRWARPAQGARAPKFCSDACKQRAYRARKQAAGASAAGAGRGSGGASGARAGSAGGSAGGSSGRGGSGHSGGQQGSSSYSSWSSGSGRQRARATHSERDMSTAEARRTVFRIAEVPDDGSSVKRAYRRATRILHPDKGSTPEQSELFKLLTLAKTVLDKAGLYV